MHKRTYLICGVILGFVLSSWWIISISGGQMPFIDEWTRKPVDLVAGSVFYTFFRFMTNFGSESFMYPFTIVVAILLVIVYRDWLQGLTFAAGTLVGHLINKGIKIIVARERPSIIAAANAEGFSFPSGHAMVTLISYGLLLFFIVRLIRSKKVIITVRIIFISLIFLIGISRYFINVHYITDILAGFFYGILILYGLLSLYKWIERWRNQRKHDTTAV